MFQADVAGVTWRKSSRSNTNGDCVELAVAPAWRKSTRSNANGDCVELAPIGSAVAVRDSKHPDDAHLAFAPRQWAAFTDAIKHDRPGVPA